MSTEGAGNRGRKVAGVALWVLIALETVMMGLAGASKFMNPDGWSSMFQGWGYAGWFAMVIGAGELGLALLLLVPRLASYASAGLIVIMLGALGTVLAHPGGRMGPGPPLVHLAVLSIVLFARWGRRWRPGDVSSDGR